MGQPNYEITRVDESSPYHSGLGRCYVITYRGRLIGQLGIHGNGYRDWSFVSGTPIPSRSTQSRLVRSVRNDR